MKATPILASWGGWNPTVSGIVTPLTMGAGMLVNRLLKLVFSSLISLWIVAQLLTYMSKMGAKRWCRGVAHMVCRLPVMSSLQTCMQWGVFGVCVCLCRLGGVGCGHCFVHFMVIWGLEKHCKTSSALIKLIGKCGGSMCCCYWRFLLLQLAQEWSWRMEWNGTWRGWK